MTAEPRPLAPGTLLAERFQIEQLLGRGGFSLAYLATDVHRQDQVVVKELAPAGLTRRDNNVLELSALGPAQAMHLRQRFLEEAVLQGRLHIRGLLPVRSSFSENGTAYFATDYLPGSITFDEIMRKQGQLNAQGALDVLYQLLETLEEIHHRGYLHRDIKPSNILVTPNGEAYLIDFGAAREWHADSSEGHNTVIFTPGYAPLEQLSERGRRGPATDLYALGATFYHAFTGQVPPSGADRVEGVPLIPVHSVRPDVDLGVCEAIEACLQPKYGDRPQSVADLREILGRKQDQPAAKDIHSLDETLLALQRFGFGKRECPACGDVLEEPKPLRKGVCPVCNQGVLRKREIQERLCPNCSASTLHRVSNGGPMSFCPLCRTGRMAKRKKGLLSKDWTFSCLSCGAVLEQTADTVKLVQTGNSIPPEHEFTDWDGWRGYSGRSEEVWLCDGCGAQYDTQSDGRWKQVLPEPRKYKSLYPEEWARVALNLSPDAGNAECDACGAEYFLEGEYLTLLSATHDPFGFEQSFAGRLLTWDEVRWYGVGKDSPNPGLVCRECGTEFDHDGGYLRLIRTDRAKLHRHIGKAKTLEDWHRAAKGLPEVSGEEQFFASIDEMLVESYRSGELGFDSHPETLWRGPAQRLEDGASSQLTVATSEMTFGGMLRKWRIPLDVVQGAEADGDTLVLRLGGQPEPTRFLLSPVELTVHLRSGDQEVLLRAADLAVRIGQQLGFKND